MADRRQAVRRDPIEVEARGKVYLAQPLPWLAAGDLGNEILRQNTEAVNNAVRIFVDAEGNIPQLEMALIRKIADWDAVLIMAYPNYERGEFGQYDADECFELGKAALEVNHLESLIDLIDPNAPTPDLSGGNATSLAGDGPKISSILSSPSEESTELPSST